MSHSFLMKTKLYFFYNLLLLQLFFIAYSQQDQVTVNDSNDKIILNFDLKSRPFVLNGTGIKTVEFVNHRDESSPGSPNLPSKIFYIAIPPQSKVEIKILNEQTKLYKDVQPESNPKVYLKDSVINYVKTEIDKKYYSSGLYPTPECEVLDYVWLRDYYCAAIRINQYRYDWLNRNLSELKNIDIELNLKDIKPFTPAWNESHFFDKVLQDVIVNYSQANKYRGTSNYANDDSTGNWIDYNAEYVKLNIPEDGIYRITYNDLLSYGINPSSIDPLKIKIYNKGIEIPLFVFGETDLSFDSGDYIEFYCEKNYSGENYKKVVQTGEDYKNYLDRYSDTTTVWLNWSGNNGKRITIQNIILSGVADTLQSHIAFKHFEKDLRLWYYDSVLPRVQLPFWQENKVWTGDFVGQSGSSTVSFTANNFVPDSPVKITARVISNAADNVSANAHRLGMGLNSLSSQDTIVFDFKQTVNFNSNYNSNQLLSGNNSITIYGLANDFSVFHQVLIDWVDVEFERNNVAEDDSLTIRVAEGYQNGIRIIKVGNITLPANQILVYKTKPNFKKITSVKLNDSVLVFTDTVTTGDEYYIVGENAFSKPVFIKKKEFVNLRDVSKGADDIIISNKILQNSANVYLDFIKGNYNLRAELIFVDDIFDEFTYGYNKPEGIRDFLKYASSNWIAPAPAYLLLLGDANYDYKKKLTPAPIIDRKNLVPSYGDPVSDAWFTMWDTTSINIPQMFVGRIPAENDDEVFRYLQKHQTYLNRRYDEFNKRYIFFSGGDIGDPNQLAQLKSTNDFVNNNLVAPAPVGGMGTHFYKTLSPSSNFGPYTREQFQNVIDSSGLIISYLGHSGTETWDNGITETSHLRNIFEDRFPLISDYGCSTGKFAEPDVDSFGELFVSGSEDGQAITYLGNSSWGYTSTSFSFPKIFYEKLLIDSTIVSSQAHLEAKIALLNQFGFSDANRVFNYCNVYFGDPLISFALPIKPNFVINNNSFTILGPNPVDIDDSVTILVNITNLGSVPADSLLISITDTRLGSENYSNEFKIPSPLFKKQLSISIPVKGLVSEHRLTIQMDKDNFFDEIYEDDNSAEFTYVVYSTSVRSLETEQFYNSAIDTLRFLNPIFFSNNPTSEINIELADNDQFTSAMQLNVNLDTLYTTIPLHLNKENKRYWWRAKLSSSQSNWSEPFSLYNEQTGLNWLFNSSFRANDVEKNKVIFDSTNQTWRLTNKNNTLEIISAGGNEGKYASFRFNQEEMLPNTFFWGIVSAEIDTLTLQPQNIQYYAFPNTVEESSSALISYIDSLKNGTVVLLAISDDAAQTVLGFSGGTPVRRAIEKLGSLYIDSVRYRESWSMIGIKGAPQGSVKESYMKLFEGPATIDTSKTVIASNGEMILPEISESAKWLYAMKSDSIPPGSNLQYFLLGIRNNSQVDTIDEVNFIDKSADLSFINASIYPKLKFLLKYYANDLLESPVFKSLGVKFVSVPELGTNYQVVSTTADTVLIGDDVDLKFYVYNVGESTADSFKVKVDVVNANNSRSTIFESTVDSLQPDSRKLFDIAYNTSSGNGARSFQINIDSDNEIKELYEDNNFYTVPFYIKQDTSKPTLTVTFNDGDILDGDYISATPNIKIELYDETLLPITDTSSVMVFLNDKQVYYANNQTVLSYEFGNENPKVVVNYTPTLEDGDYNLKVFGKNSLGTLVDSAGYEKRFQVSNEVQLLNVYNYPNPTSGETYFTFKLTQIPDEIKIKIYTIAGRLIREIKVPSTNLKYDFNKIYWNGRDEDGDVPANGVYLYKMILTAGEKTEDVIQKLAIVR